ncbi:asparagine synthetase [Backusella circina FSU 941]|nr:asparagine synthetase [Backusella circina FSU 941]
MCGISCYLKFKDNTDPTPLDIDTSLDIINHRGPDDRGVFISPDGRCVLGHNRLSIIDLSGGHQPFTSKCGNIHCVVNGEFYDFKSIRSDLEVKGHIFTTKSDSEIALHLYEEYGLSFVDHLRGEFAICIWDARVQRLIAVRDRFGLKPLHYTVVNNTLMLASEIKAFLPLGWRPQWDMSSIVHFNHIFGNKTCFKGVHRIPPGHYLVATSNGAIEFFPYWGPEYPDKNGKETRSVNEMIDGVREHLVDAVRQRLIADTPVGIYLSGGIDSSAILGIATKLLREKNPNAKVHTFSISFFNGGDLDESEITKRTAKYWDVEQDIITVSYSDLVGHFEKVVWHGEQPIANFSTVSKMLLSEKAQARGCKVVLTGEGSDEIFGGYGFFNPEILREPDLTMSDVFEKIPESERLNKLAEQLPRNMINGVNVQSSLVKFLGYTRALFSDTAVKEYGVPNPKLSAIENLTGIDRFKAKHRWHPLHTALYLENHSFLPNYLVAIGGDRTEMMNSIEGRTSFLDHPLVEYVNGLPPSVKIKYEKDGTLNEKWILKEAARPFITEEIYKRTKQPFVAPVPEATDPSIVDFISKMVTKENVAKLGWANVEYIEELKCQYFDTRSHVAFTNLLFIMSYIVISQRFNVPAYV